MGKNDIVFKLYQNTIKAAEVMCSVLLAGMVVIVFSNVIARYYFSASLAWSEELARFMLIWLVFMGAVLAYVQNEHLGLDLLVKKIPRKAAYIVTVVADVLVLYAVWMLLQGGYMMMIDSWDWEAPATYIPFGYIYAIIPICGAVMAFQTLLKMSVSIKAITRG